MKTQKAKSIPNAEHCMVLVMQKESINTSVKYWYLAAGLDTWQQGNRTEEKVGGVEKSFECSIYNWGKATE